MTRDCDHRRLTNRSDDSGVKLKLRQIAYLRKRPRMKRGRPSCRRKLGRAFLSSSLLSSTSFLTNVASCSVVYVRSTYCALNIPNLDSPGNCSSLLGDILFLSSKMCRSMRCGSGSRRRTGWSRRKRRRQCRLNRSVIAWTPSWPRSRITWTSRIARSTFCNARWAVSRIYSTSSFLAREISSLETQSSKSFEGSLSFHRHLFSTTFVYFSHFSDSCANSFS